VELASLQEVAQRLTEDSMRLCQRIQLLGVFARFDRIFLRGIGFTTPDHLLERLHVNKAELLVVLDRPEVLLQTNGSENDIRCYLTWRTVSAGARSDAGRDCRDAFPGLAKTCDKTGIAVWDHLGSRLKVAGQIVVQPLDRYVRERFRLTRSTGVPTALPLFSTGSSNSLFHGMIHALWVFCPMRSRPILPNQTGFSQCPVSAHACSPLSLWPRFRSPRPCTPRRRPGLSWRRTTASWSARPGPAPRQEPPAPARPILP
jgi:hypothetical protein